MVERRVVRVERSMTKNPSAVKGSSSSTIRLRVSSVSTAPADLLPENAL